MHDLCLVCSTNCISFHLVVRMEWVLLTIIHFPSLKEMLFGWILHKCKSRGREGKKEWNVEFICDLKMLNIFCNAKWISIKFSIKWVHSIRIHLQLNLWCSWSANLLSSSSSKRWNTIICSVFTLTHSVAFQLIRQIVNGLENLREGKKYVDPWYLLVRVVPSIARSKSVSWVKTTIWFHFMFV